MAPKPFLLLFKSEVLPHLTDCPSKGTRFIHFRTSLNTSAWLDTILTQVYFVICANLNILNTGDTQAFLNNKSGINTIVVSTVSHSTTYHSKSLQHTIKS